MPAEISFIKQQYSTIANISISALVNAIGKQANYITETTNGTKCYINENNAFGAGDKINANAILLYIYLHFLGPDANSHVVLDLTEACSFLSMTKRTLINNLRILRKHSYVNYVEGLLEDTYDIHVEYYESISLSATSGGRGYLSLTRSMFEHIISLKHINQLRLTLRTLLCSVPGKQNIGLTTGCSMSSLKRIFPVSTKHKDIIALLKDSSIKQIFDVNVSRGFKYCILSMKKNLDINKAKSDLLNTTKSKISKLFDSLNLKHSDNVFKPTSKELTDICKIVLREPYEHIEIAIKKLYYHYTRQSVDNLPALIRTLASG